MEFNIQRELFVEGIQKTLGIVEKKTTMPILSNLLLREDAAAVVLDRVAELARWLSRAPLPVAVVTNETGLGLVPATPLGRLFRDVAGEANQLLAGACQDVLLVSCGLPLPLKGVTPEVLR